MRGIPVGTCRSCGAEVSYFARSCWHCGASNLPNPVVTVLAIAVMAVVAGVIVLGSLIFIRSKDEAPGGIATPEQKAEGGEQYGWLVKAMAECEEEAKRTTDKVYFLIAPVTRTATNAAGWEPGRIGMVGDSIELLPSTNAVIGLRNGSLAIYRTPLAFAVSDPATSTVFRWKPAAGVTVLTQRAAGLESLKLGFQVAEGKDIDWGITITLAQGTCYWIYPLIRTGGRGG
jgi:hypothetical protein